MICISCGKFAIKSNVETCGNCLEDIWCQYEDLFDADLVSWVK